MPGCQELSIYAGLLKTIKIIWPFMQSEPSIMYVSPLSPFFCEVILINLIVGIVVERGFHQLSNLSNVEIQTQSKSIGKFLK